MPMIWLPEEELRALQAALTIAERVDWAAYDRAKQFLIQPRTEPPVWESPSESMTDSV